MTAPAAGRHAMGGDDDIVGRFTRRELREMGARTLEHIWANPSTEPLLTEPEPARASRTCKRGHEGAARTRQGTCATCKGEQQRERRGKA